MPNIYNYCPFYGLQLTPLSPSLVNKSLAPSLSSPGSTAALTTKDHRKKNTNKTKQNYNQQNFLKG